MEPVRGPTGGNTLIACEQFNIWPTEFSNVRGAAIDFTQVVHMHSLACPRLHEQFLSPCAAESVPGLAALWAAPPFHSQSDGGDVSGFGE